MSDEETNDLGDEPKNDANSIPSEDNGKTVAIIAHLTVIGYIAAIIMNSQNKTEIGTFYLRQLLGLWIIAVVFSFVPFVGCITGVIVLIFVILSLVNAVNGKMEPVWGVGTYFQDWFKGIF